MIELRAMWGIKKTRTTLYHPQGNGVVERGNRTLGDALSTPLLSGGLGQAVASDRKGL